MPDSSAYIRDMLTSRILLAAAALFAAAPAVAMAQPTAEQQAVIAVADSALAAITRGDAIGFTDLFVNEAVMFPTGTRDGVAVYRARTRESQRTSALTGIVERGFSPRALVSGGVAMVWMPYDLYQNGEWSHCGVDVFTLVKSGSAWRISSLAWSVEQPPACPKHPAGPPKK